MSHREASKENRQTLSIDAQPSFGRLPRRFGLESRGLTMLSGNDGRSGARVVEEKINSNFEILHSDPRHALVVLLRTLNSVIDSESVSSEPIVGRQASPQSWLLSTLAPKQAKVSQTWPFYQDGHRCFDARSKHRATP